MTVRKRKVDLERVRSRLYSIVLSGEDREAVQAARVLLSERREETATGPDIDLLEKLAEQSRKWPRR